ncbi:hypothetical protein HG536_0G04300 [Torulaspora globosa]|uniref:BZIP domain-containing protein n=1 Tax=Torulaspora globosa TaxID=48254 RepID=A0A7G3ZM32_9SACH|nr:uncharacterized protein HG536_0G04300 [Torulaspora globosa]QLL34568.1 hypothetical protein HG536_0G04300 [Torulaspora globosa]
MAQNDRRNGVVPVSESASMFDLEPNPFEQSFASTKKSQPTSGAVPSPQDQRLAGVAGQTGEKSSKVTIPEINSNIKESDVGNQRRSSVFSYGTQKPHLQSPPLLTPGGSRRLPPILLSPNFIQQAPSGSLAVQGPLGSLMANYSSMSPKNELPSADTELQRPPLSLGLSKTVFAANESSLRTGLTPNIQGTIAQVGPTHHPAHALPYFGGPRNDIGSQEDNRSATVYGTSMATGSDLGGPSQPYTPGIGSLLGFSSTQAFQRSTNPPPRNGVLPVAGPLADPNSAQRFAQIQNYTAEPITASIKDQHTKSLGSNSPPRTAVRRKRKSSTPSRGSKSSKSSRRNTPTSHDSKNAGKKEVSDSADKDSDDGQERKRREFLERNRVAASKFRKRKKEYIKRVETDLKFYEAEYEDMSHAINKLCGIVNVSCSPVASSSLVCMLETAISKNDAPSSLSILAHIKQILYQTRYFQRNGRNPRREIEYPPDSDDDDRQRTDKESSSRHNSIAAIPSSVNSSRAPDTSIPGPVAASYITSGGPPSGGTGSSKSTLTDTTSAPSIVKEEDPVPAVYTIPLAEDKKSSDGSTVASAIGTISSLPTVINGRPVIPLSDIDPHRNSDPSSISGIRQSSLVNLTSDVVNTEQISFKYPNSD